MGDMLAVANRRVMWLLGYVLYSAWALYSVIEYTGPGRWIGDLQLHAFGRKSGELTLVLLLVPVIVVMRTVGRTGPTEPYSELIQRLGLARLVWPAVLLGIGGIVAYIVGGQAFATDRGRLSAAEASRIDGRFYATIQGMPGEGITVQTGSEIPEIYVPMLDIREDGASNSLLVIEVSEDRASRLRPNEQGEVEISGFIDSNVPGDVRAWLEDKTHLKPESVRVLHTNVTRDKARIFFWIVVSLSIVATATAWIRGHRGATTTTSRIPTTQSQTR